MKRTLPGEIWRVHFGLAAKVRPAPVLSGYPADDELAMLVVRLHFRCRVHQGPAEMRQCQKIERNRVLLDVANPPGTLHPKLRGDAKQLLNWARNETKHSPIAGTDTVPVPDGGPDNAGGGPRAGRQTLKPGARSGRGNDGRSSVRASNARVKK